MSDLLYIHFMFILWPRNCNRTVRQVSLQGIGINSLHFDYETLFVIFAIVPDLCAICFPRFTSFLYMQLPLQLCLCSLFIFFYPSFPIMWLWLVCLKTCLRLVKHEGSDIVWPLVFLRIKKIKFPRTYRFLLYCGSGSSGLNELPLQKLKMVGPWALSPSLKWQLQIRLFGIHALSAHLYTQWQFLLTFKFSFRREKNVKLHSCTKKLH